MGLLQHSSFSIQHYNTRRQWPTRRPKSPSVPRASCESRASVMPMMNDECGMMNGSSSAFIIQHSSLQYAPPMADPTSKIPLLSVVVPCYNERATVAELLRRVREVPIDKEIIVIDDQSTDGSKDIVAALA